MTDFDDDADALVRVCDELVAQQRVQGNLAIELPPVAALQLASLIQVVRRRPLPPADQKLTAALLVLVRGFFANCPAVLAVLADGDDPDPDRRPVFDPQTRH